MADNKKNQKTGLGSPSRPVTKTGSPKKTVGSVARNVKSAVKNPTSPNYAPGRVIRNVKAAKPYVREVKRLTGASTVKAARASYKTIKQDPTGLGRAIREQSEIGKSNFIRGGLGGAWGSGGDIKAKKSR